MYIYNYILLVGFVGLYFNHKTKFAAETFLFGWAVYLLMVFGIGFKYYFLLSAAIELAIAYRLNYKYRAVAYVSYSLILVNIAGLILHINGVKSYYDDIYAVLSITQFALLLSRLIPDGIRRLLVQRITLRGHNYDGGKTCAKMYKTTPTDKKPQ